MTLDWKSRSISRRFVISVQVSFSQSPSRDIDLAQDCKFGQQPANRADWPGWPGGQADRWPLGSAAQPPADPKWPPLTSHDTAFWEDGHRGHSASVRSFRVRSAVSNVAWPFTVPTLTRVRNCQGTSLHRTIDDLRKSRGLHSVRAFGHGPVYI